MHTSARRLTLLIHSLAGGGAERVFSMLANHWAAQGHTVTLMTLDRVENDLYPLDPRVRRIGLDLLRESHNAWQAVRNNWTQIRQLRRAVRQSRPERIVSFIEAMNITALLACRGLDGGVIIAERTDPRHHPVGRIWSRLRRWTYPRCRALVVQTEAVREWMRPMLRGRPIHVIPNAVPPVENSSRNRSQDGRHRILAMGRLARVKGFDLLIRAFAPVADRFPDWTLEILGEGPERASLQRLIEESRLRDRVILRGWMADPTPCLRQGDFFVLPSRYEGFPNALLEAMACGLPAVSFDIESGPREIIRHEIDGLLIPAEDVEALASALQRLMSDAELRQRLAAQAAKVTERFSPKRFFQQWDGVLEMESEEGERVKE